MIDLNWMAGFFDGEGSIIISVKRPRTTFLRVSLGNTDLGAITMFHDYFGGHLSAPVVEKPGRLPFYRWAIVYDNAEKFCRVMEPMLKVKKRQAQLALEYCAYRPSRTKDGHYMSDKTITLDNVYRQRMSELNHGRRLIEIDR